MGKIKRFLAVLIALAVFAVPVFASLCQFPMILESIIPTLGLIALLLAPLFAALGVLVKSRKATLFWMAKISVVCAVLLFLVASVTGPLLLTMVQEFVFVTVILFLAAGLIFVLGIAMTARRNLLMRLAKYAAIGAVAFVGLIVLSLINNVVAGKPPYCEPGTEPLSIGICGQYECVPFDPLGGQLCASSNYTLCKFGCACSTDGGGIGQCLRHTMAITEKETCSCPTQLFNETGCISAYQTVSCCLV